jgi:hypothetical protein
MMNEQILERLRKEFAFVGDEKISGHTAMKFRRKPEGISPKRHLAWRCCRTQMLIRITKL